MNDTSKMASDKELSDERKWRVSQAFEQLLEPKTLGEFFRLWNAHGKERALKLVKVEEGDVDAFLDYLKDYEFPKERYWW